jgi:Telomere-capping, CST complex subunit
VKIGYGTNLYLEKYSPKQPISGMIMAFVDKIGNPATIQKEIASSARIYGTIGNLDLYASTCTLSHKQNDILIDTTLIGPFPYRKGEIYYAYGSFTKGTPNTLNLKATILKNVAQLDLRLMEAVLDARFAYFNDTRSSKG